MTRARDHLSEDALQALLDDSLPETEAERAREHLASCARCRAELDAWAVLFEGLGSIEEVDPPVAFAERVMEALPDRTERPLAARLRGWLGLTGPTPSHLAAGTVQELIEGTLPRPEVEGAERHLHHCRACREEVDDWRALMTRLDDVPRIAPSAEFSERVMAHVRIRSAIQVAKPTARERLVAWLAGISPRTRRRLAAVAGAAVTPLVTVALVAWVVFTHPRVSLGTLAGFVRLQLQDALTGLETLLLGGSAEGGALASAVETLQAVGSSPGSALTVLTLFSVATLAASWILYRNLIATNRVDGRYAHHSI